MAMRSYENPHCVSFDEFKEDLYRIITIKKSITKYLCGDDLNVRMILNQFIILCNVFGDTAFELLKYKLDEKQYPVAFAFMVQLNRLPVSEMIFLDQYVVHELRKI
jgi:hypothetical protein